MRKSLKHITRTREVFGANMRARRLMRGLSQEGLGEASGLHRCFIGNVERGEQNISIDNMEGIADALDVVLIVDLVPKKGKKTKR